MSENLANFGGKQNKMAPFLIIFFDKLYPMKIGPGVLACATRGGGRSEAGHCFHLLFSSSSFFLFLFLFLLRLLLFTHFGESPVCEYLFPPIFWQKKIFFFGNFFSPRKKGHFRAIFRYGQRSVAEPGPTPSSWSILAMYLYGFRTSPSWYIRIPPPL